MNRGISYVSLLELHSGKTGHSWERLIQKSRENIKDSTDSFMSVPLLNCYTVS